MRTGRFGPFGNGRCHYGGRNTRHSAGDAADLSSGDAARHGAHSCCKRFFRRSGVAGGRWNGLWNKSWRGQFPWRENFWGHVDHASIEGGGGGAGAIGGMGATRSVVSNLFMSIPCEK